MITYQTVSFHKVIYLLSLCTRGLIYRMTVVLYLELNR